jgi:hypothetical protein
MFENLIATCRGHAKNEMSRYIHVAVIMKGKKPIVLKFNDYNRVCIDGRLDTAMHAEQNCCRNFDKVKGKFIVLRFTKDGNLADSRPCRKCKSMMISKGIKSIYCSNDKGFIEKIKLVDLEEYESNSQQKFLTLKKRGAFHILI